MNKLSYDAPNSGFLSLKGSIALKNKSSLVDCIEKDGVLEMQVYQDGGRGGGGTETHW